MVNYRYKPGTAGLVKEYGSRQSRSLRQCEVSKKNITSSATRTCTAWRITLSRLLLYCQFTVSKRTIPPWLIHVSMHREQGENDKMMNLKQVPATKYQCCWFLNDLTPPYIMADNDYHLEENYTVSFSQRHPRKKVIRRRIHINLKHTAVNNPLSAPSFAFMPISIIHSYKQVESLHGSISGKYFRDYTRYLSTLTSILFTHF
jgi:hypothetical protein